MSKEKINFYDKKYTLVLDEKGKLSALRYGEVWRDLTGDGLVLAMFNEISKLNSDIVGLKNKVEK